MPGGLLRRRLVSGLVRPRDVGNRGPGDVPVAIGETLARLRRAPEGRAELCQQSDTDDQRGEQTFPQGTSLEISCRAMAPTAHDHRLPKNGINLTRAMAPLCYQILLIASLCALARVENAVTFPFCHSPPRIVSEEKNCFYNKHNLFMTSDDSSQHHSREERRSILLQRFWSLRSQV
jgi:hypothetical protein